MRERLGVLFVGKLQVFTTSVAVAIVVSTVYLSVDIQGSESWQMK
jgi:hypothetical protein